MGLRIWGEPGVWRKGGGWEEGGRAAREQEGRPWTSERSEPFSARCSRICHFPHLTLLIFPSTRQTVCPLKDPLRFWQSHDQAPPNLTQLALPSMSSLSPIRPRLMRSRNQQTQRRGNYPNVHQFHVDNLLCPHNGTLLGHKKE